MGKLKMSSSQLAVLYRQMSQKIYVQHSDLEIKAWSAVINIIKIFQKC